MSIFTVHFIYGIISIIVHLTVHQQNEFKEDENFIHDKILLLHVAIICCSIFGWIRECNSQNCEDRKLLAKTLFIHAILAIIFIFFQLGKNFNIFELIMHAIVALWNTIKLICCLPSQKSNTYQSSYSFS